MVDVNEAFESENGFIVEDAAGFFSGTGTPTFTAPNGSIYTDTLNSVMFMRVRGRWVRNDEENRYIPEGEILEVSDYAYMQFHHTIFIEGVLSIGQNATVEVVS